MSKKLLLPVAAVLLHPLSVSAAPLELLPEPAVHVGQAAARAEPPVRLAAARGNMGGGFIEFLFGDGPPQGGRYQQQPGYQPSYEPRLLPPLGAEQAMRRQEDVSEPGRPAFDPKYEKQLVDYHGKESAGTIIVDTPNKFLFLVQGDGKALRYGIGVGRPGFEWAGVKSVTMKREWPDWRPPAQMLKRRPDLPVTWWAGRATRLARPRSISAPRSTASTARTSLTPSDRRCLQAASAC